MAEETLKTAATEAPAEVAAVATEAPEAEKEKVEAPPAAEVCEKDAPEAVAEPVAEEKVKESVVEEEKEKITESTSFKEESNVAGELPDPQKKALDELKQLVQEALNKHEFTAPPKPVKEEKPAPEEKKPAPEEKKPAEEETKPAEEEKKPAEEEKKPEAEEEKPAEEKKAETVDETAEKDAPAPPATSEPVEPAVECKEEEKTAAPAEPVVEAPEPVKEVIAVIEKTETCVEEEDGSKKIEAIEETIVAVTATSEETEQPAPEAAVEETPVAPEEVSIWGIPLLADERSDVVLLKFLRARDFKVKEAFTMLKNVVAWRKEFGIDSLLDEDLGTEQEKVVYMHGVDKEGHPVCYNAYSEYQNK